MATTKKCIKFYADQDIEEFLESIPAQTKSTWLNAAVRAAMEAQAGREHSELSELKSWLQDQKKAPPLYAALADMLELFSKR